MSANITIGGQTFACVPLKDADFTDVAAIYVILCVQQDGSWNVLDVGQTGELGTRISAHDRKTCWERNCPNKNIWVCIYPMPASRYTKEDRLKFEQTLRTQYDPPCGKR